MSEVRVDFCCVVISGKDGCFKWNGECLGSFPAQYPRSTLSFAHDGAILELRVDGRPGAQCMRGSRELEEMTHLFAAVVFEQSERPSEIVEACWTILP